MDNAQLIDAIYEASIVPEKWGEVLDRILVFSGSASGTLFVNDGHATPRWKTTERSRDAVEQFVATEAWKDTARNPIRLIDASIGDHYFHHAEDVMTADELARDAILNLLRGAGLGWQIGTAIPMPTNEFVVFAFERNQADGRHDANSMSRLAAIRPHLARATMVATRLGIERARGSLDAMTALGLPAVLLDRKGIVREANAWMTPDLITTRAGGRIVLDHAAGEIALDAILGGRSSTRSIALPASGARPGRIVHVIPLSGDAQDIFSGSLSLLIMNVAAGPRDQPDPAILRGLFDLSPAEARLAAALASGLSLDAASAACGIRYSTARSYLERIFAKTGVHRQAELAALLATSLVPHRFT